MEVICMLIVLYVVFDMVIHYETLDQKFKKLDDDMTNTFKSDKWLREHQCHYNKYGSVVDKNNNIVIK